MLVRNIVWCFSYHWYPKPPSPLRTTRTIVARCLVRPSERLDRLMILEVVRVVSTSKLWRLRDGPGIRVKTYIEEVRFRYDDVTFAHAAVGNPAVHCAHTHEHPSAAAVSIAGNTMPARRN